MQLLDLIELIMAMFISIKTIGMIYTYTYWANSLVCDETKGN